MPPVGVPSGTRTSGLRGAVGSGVEAGFVVMGVVALAAAGRLLVETNPVLAAPKPGGLPKLTGLVSGFSEFAGAPNRVSRLRAVRGGTSRRGNSSVSSKAGRKPPVCRVAGCADAYAAA